MLADGWPGDGERAGDLADGSLTEAARTLFATLRELDEAEVDVLLFEPCGTHEGLGHAIDDRLRRAAADRPVEG